MAMMIFGLGLWIVSLLAILDRMQCMINVYPNCQNTIKPMPNLF